MTEESTEVAVATPEPEKDDVAEDAKFVQSTLYGLVADMREGMDTAKEILANTEHPRAVEVYSDMANKTANIAMMIMENQRQKQKIDLAAGKVDVNKAKEIGFVGTIADLQLMMAEQRKDTVAEEAVVIDAKVEEAQ